MKRALLLGATLLASCGDAPQTGGFETTDLQARAVRPDGTPVASARVWLVRSAGSDGPAAVLDSGFTDASGIVRFATPDGGAEGLGLDAVRGDSLGLSPLALTESDTARVVVSRSHVVTAPAVPAGSARLFVPGSHFASSLDGFSTARLLLPSGNWDLAIRVAGSVSVTKVAVSGDTVLPGATGSEMDTTARVSANVYAARIQYQTLDGLELDVVNDSTAPLDSLTIRLYMEGARAELSDLAVRPDVAQLYAAAGFNAPLALDTARWRRVVPRAIGPCGTTGICSWAVDLPVEQATIAAGGRLHLSLLFDKHAGGTGDTLQYANVHPTHDPFSGRDWSFRPRAWADSTTPTQGLPDYAGVAASTGSLPSSPNPYIVLLRKEQLVSGKPPSLQL